MHRDLPDFVKRMLQAPLARETLSLVRRCNIGDDKWKVFCLAEGGAWKRKKQKEIAVDYNISPARVSTIVKDVSTRLIRAVAEPDAPDMVRAYRKSRFAELKNLKFSNVGTVFNITNLFLSDRCDKHHERHHLGWDCKVDFVADGESLAITGRSRTTDGFSAYTIFWSEKSDGTTEAVAGNLFGGFNSSGDNYPAVRDSFLLIDFKEMFWAVGRCSIRQDKQQLTIYLEPADIKQIDRPPRMHTARDISAGKKSLKSVGRMSNPDEPGHVFLDTKSLERLALDKISGKVAL